MSSSVATTAEEYNNVQSGKNDSSRGSGSGKRIAHGRSVTLSPEHYVLAGPGKSGVMAQDVRPGDVMWTAVDGTSMESEEEYNADDGGSIVKKTELVRATVASVQRVSATGVFSPFTVEGTLIVDGVLVSAYASSPPIKVGPTVLVDGSTVAHMAMTPLRTVCGLVPSLCAPEVHTGHLGRHPYIDFLDSVGETFTPVTTTAAQRHEQELQSSELSQEEEEKVQPSSPEPGTTPTAAAAAAAASSRRSGSRQLDLATAFESAGQMLLVAAGLVVLALISLTHVLLECFTMALSVAIPAGIITLTLRAARSKQ